MWQQQLLGNTSLNATGFAAAAVTTPTALITAAGDLLVRYTANGTSPISQVASSSYLTSISLTGQAGFTVPTLTAGTTATIGRDGVTLESPWVTVTPGFISRFVITQSTLGTVPYTAVVRSAAGLVLGGTLTGTLAPGRVTIIPITALLPADTTATPGPYQVTFTIAANTDFVRGSYVLTTPTNTVTNTPLYTSLPQ
jgi:hypothetical protein